SFNDFSGCGSLPGARIDPKSSSFLQLLSYRLLLQLDSAPLDASFCSTRSELTQGQCRNRKRLRVRRLPRSMSDGEQLIPKSGAFTPLIRRSPPSTPLARSTRLLQKLERDLMTNLESDTAPEQSDTQVYEWDDYNVSIFEQMFTGALELFSEPRAEAGKHHGMFGCQLLEVNAAKQTALGP
ncbi:hypothetical protein COOONC_13764, partial [Cooperia oncophora]